MLIIHDNHFVLVGWQGISLLNRRMWYRLALCSPKSQTKKPSHWEDHFSEQFLVYRSQSTISTLPPRKVTHPSWMSFAQLQLSGCVASWWARLSLLGDLVDLSEDKAKCLSMLSKRFVIDPMALRRRPWFSVKTSNTDGLRHQQICFIHGLSWKCVLHNVVVVVDPTPTPLCHPSSPPPSFLAKRYFWVPGGGKLHYF